MHTRLNSPCPMSSTGWRGIKHWIKKWKNFPLLSNGASLLVDNWLHKKGILFFFCSTKSITGLQNLHLACNLNGGYLSYKLGYFSIFVIKNILFHFSFCMTTHFTFQCWVYIIFIVMLISSLFILSSIFFCTALTSFPCWAH